ARACVAVNLPSPVVAALDHVDVLAVRDLEHMPEVLLAPALDVEHVAGVEIASRENLECESPALLEANLRGRRRSSRRSRRPSTTCSSSITLDRCVADRAEESAVHFRQLPPAQQLRLEALAELQDRGAARWN